MHENSFNQIRFHASRLMICRTALKSTKRSIDNTMVMDRSSIKVTRINALLAQTRMLQL